MLTGAHEKEILMRGRLQGKTAFITGAGAGIGRACVDLFIAEGASVAIADINEPEGRAAAAPFTSDEALFIATDVTDEQSVGDALEQSAARFGQINTIINCAGGSIAEDGPVTDVDLSVFDHTINLDLKGPFLCCRLGIPHLIQAGGGSIVNFTSIVALRGAFRGHVYTAAKGAIISLTQGIAGRYWRQGIRANAIAPGIVLSDRVRDRLRLDPGDSIERQLDAVQASSGPMVDDRHPFGFGTPGDIANIALFLASDESRMINAAVIPAEGGASHY